MPYTLIIQHKDDFRRKGDYHREIMNAPRL
jgi:hypothetical protein